MLSSAAPAEEDDEIDVECDAEVSNCSSSSGSRRPEDVGEAQDLSVKRRRPLEEDAQEEQQEEREEQEERGAGSLEPKIEQ